MNDVNDNRSLCSFCSLLCEPLDGHADFGETFCSRRNRELDRLRSAPPLPALSVSEVEKGFEFAGARTRWQKAQRRLVTGRIRSVETARSAVRLAQCYGATIDLWESEATFESIASMQRSGSYAVSLTEARDLSTLIIVIGSDAMLEDYPRLPIALSKAERIPVLLLGDWSDRACGAWVEAGFDVLAISTEIEHLPRSLAQSFVAAQSMEWDSRVGDWLQRSRYTSVVWSTQHLGFLHADLWIDSMQQWIATRNETHRCGAMVWGGLEGACQQVCTWLTGFPGRIQFRDGHAEYDPYRHSASRWLERTRSLGRESVDSIAIWIDESSDDLPNEVIESGIPMIVVGPKAPHSRWETLHWFPSQRSGFGANADFFRGDQVVQVRGCDPQGILVELPSVATWLRRLTAP